MNRIARTIALTLTTALAVLAAPGTAQASDPMDVLLPYDAPCVVAAQQPQSHAANRCRNRGWTVTRHLVVDPQARLRWSDLDSFKVRDLADPRTRTATLKGKRVRLIVFRSVITPSMDTGLDNLVTPRDWSACTYLTGQGILGALYGADSVVLCPDAQAYAIGTAYRPGDVIPRP